MLSGEKPIRPKAAAELINLSLSTLYKKSSRHEIPLCKKGKMLYFFESELLAYLAAGRVPTIEENEAIAATQNLDR